MGLGGCDRADFSVVSLPSIRAATENTFPAPLLLPIGTAPLARAIHCYNSCTCVQNMLEQWQLWAVIAKRYFLYLPEIFFSFLFCPFVKTADLFLPARLLLLYLVLNARFFAMHTLAHMHPTTPRDGGVG